VNEPMIFECSICADPSTEICVCCAKDACNNHLCIRCRSCSDCCGCEVPLTADVPPPAFIERVVEVEPPQAAAASE
jgi:hypothetical protein